MKSIVLAFILSAVCALAAPVKLQWSASPDASVAGYYLYGSTNSLAGTNAPLLRVDAGTNRTATVDCGDGGTWYFAATAYDSNRLESARCPELAVAFPRPPAVIAVLAVESGTLPGTNWATAYRIKITTP